MFFFNDKISRIYLYIFWTSLSFHEKTENKIIREKNNIFILITLFTLINIIYMCKDLSFSHCKTLCQQFSISMNREEIYKINIRDKKKK